VDSWKKALECLDNQIDSSELSKAIKEDKFDGEFALSEDGLKDLKTKVAELLTIESAVANQTVIERVNKDSYPKHMKTALTKVEEKLKPLMDKFGVDYSDGYASDKLEELGEAIEAQSKGDEGSVKLLESQKETREVKLELKQKVADHVEEIRQLNTDNDMTALRSVFNYKVTDQKWADVYNIPDVKESIINSKWDKLLSNAVPKLDKGEILLFQRDNPELRIFGDDNKELSFQSWRETEFSDIIKKSETPIVVAQSKEVDLTDDQIRQRANHEKFRESNTGRT